MNNRMKTYIHIMSRDTGTELTPKHYEILEFAYEYYHQHKVGPLYQNIKKHTGATKDDIGKLFPHGLNSVYTWVGIPIQTTEKGCKPIADIKADNYREVYLDYNSTTPLRAEVIEALQKFYGDIRTFGNPSNSTNLGEEAYNIIHTARKDIASLLGVKTNTITFCGSGSEAINTALKGIALNHLGNKGHFVTSNIEHSAVLETLDFLRTIGFDVTYVKVPEDGVIRTKDIEHAIRPDTIGVSVMAVNNEIGTIAPLKEIGKICKDKNVPFIVDAAQAFGKIPLRPKQMHISVLTLTGHKIYAPKGVAAMYIDESITLTPLVHGGGQENNLRGGTENVGAILAFGLASKLIHRDMDKEWFRLAALRDYFIERLRECEKGYVLNGSIEERLPNNLNIGFPEIDSGSLLLSLNQVGIYVSSGSACHSGSQEDSHVLKAIGANTRDYGNIRFSFGINTTKADIDYVFEYLPKILKQLREDS